VQFICLGPQCWGAGPTAGIAVAQAKKAYPKFNGKYMQYDLYLCGDEDFVDWQGNLRAFKPPKKIREVRFSPTGQRMVKEKFDAQVQPV
jgi:hypothetical protein